MTNKYYGWKLFLGQRSYQASLEWQHRMVRYRLAGTIRDTLFFLEHPDVVTVGRDAKEEDYNCVPPNIEIHKIARGGAVTYHGPGQLVVYPIFNLTRRKKDLHAFIRNIEEGIIRAFAEYDLSCRRKDGHTGVWVEDRKIASIGVGVSKWISFHGAAINLTTNLDKFQMIHPCGLAPDVMTTAEKEIGIKIGLKEFSDKLVTSFSEVFETSFQEANFEEILELIDAEENTQSL